MSRYSLDGVDENWDSALTPKKAKMRNGVVLSVKSEKPKKRKGDTMKDVLEELDKSQEKKQKKHKKAVGKS